MMTRTRIGEWLFWRRPPDSFKILVLACFIWLPTLDLAHGYRCKYYQVPKCNSTTSESCLCFNCPVCPPGKELSPPCTSYKELPWNTTMKCVPCKNGTFSEGFSIGSCHICSECYTHKTIRECNATHDAMCSKECKDGYQWDKDYEMCWEVNLPPTKKASTTAEIPMKNQSTEHPTTMNIPADKLINHTTQIMETTTPKNGSTNKTQSINENKRANESVIHVILGDFFALGITVVVALVLGFLGFKKRKTLLEFMCRIYCLTCKKLSSTEYQENQDPESIPMQPVQGRLDQMDIASGSKDQMEDQVQLISEAQGTQDTDQTIPDQQMIKDLENSNLKPQDQPSKKDLIPIDSRPPDKEEQNRETTRSSVSQPDVNPDVLDGLLLRDLRHDLKHTISVLISQKHLKGWKQIGDKYEMSKVQLTEIETRCSYADGSMLPGESLLEFLKSSKPDFTLRDFTLLLRDLQREDVIREIQKEHQLSL